MVLTFIFVSATLPDIVKDCIKEEFGKYIHVTQGPGIHRVALTVTEYMVDVSVSDVQKDCMCFEIKAKESQLTLHQTTCECKLIFCNTVKSCISTPQFIKLNSTTNIAYKPVVDVASKDFKIQETVFKVFQADHRGRNFEVPVSLDNLMKQYFTPDFIYQFMSLSNKYRKNRVKQKPDLYILNHVRTVAKEFVYLLGTILSLDEMMIRFFL